MSDHIAMADESKTDGAVLKDMLRPYRALAILCCPIFATLISYGYDLVLFMHQEVVHESRQDASVQRLNAKVDEQGGELDRLHKRHLDLLQLTITDLDIVRATQIRLLPPKARARARRDFELQRANALRLLVDAQKSP